MKLKNYHNAGERAAYTATALGLRCNLDYESYGATDSVRITKDDEIIFHSTVSDATSFLCGLYTKIQSILSLFSAEGIDPQDKERALKSISETCLPTHITRVYMQHIFQNKDLVRELKR